MVVLAAGLEFPGELTEVDFGLVAAFAGASIGAEEVFGDVGAFLREETDFVPSVLAGAFLPADFFAGASLTAFLAGGVLDGLVEVFLVVPVAFLGDLGSAAFLTGVTDFLAERVGVFLAMISGGERI